MESGTVQCTDIDVASVSFLRDRNCSLTELGGRRFLFVCFFPDVQELLLAMHLNSVP